MKTVTNRLPNYDMIPRPIRNRVADVLNYHEYIGPNLTIT